MTTTILGTLAPTVLIAGTVLGYVAQRLRSKRENERVLDVPLGRVAFAMNLVRTRQRRSR